MPRKAGFLAPISKAVQNLCSRLRVRRPFHHAVCRSYSAPTKTRRPLPISLQARSCSKFANTGNQFAVFGILQLPDARFQRPKLRFASSLSGKRLLMTQTFRDLFRSEVIGATVGIAVRDVSLVFTDLKGSTALYERIGDPNAHIQ